MLGRCNRTVNPYQILAFVILMVLSPLYPVIHPLHLWIPHSQCPLNLSHPSCPQCYPLTQPLSSPVWWLQKLPAQPSWIHPHPVFTPFSKFLVWLFLKTNSAHVNFRLSWTSFSSSNGQHPAFPPHNTRFPLLGPWPRSASTTGWLRLLAAPHISIRLPAHYPDSFRCPC